MNIDIGQPASDELEVTTLGAGASNGESLVIHLADDEWIIIDSCKVGERVLPLSYLNDIGVPYSKVTKVICTHWHTDHICGLAEILFECKNAQFCLAPVSDFNGYLNIVLKAAGIDPLGSNVWNVLNSCLDVLEKEGRREPRLLTHNERVIHLTTGTDMFVVGPSDEMIKRFNASLLKIDPNKPDRQSLETMEGNMCSMAFSVNYRGIKILIGGDMETGRIKSQKYQHKLCNNKCPEHEPCGWCDAINPGNVLADERPYHFVNMPHHSSSSSYCPKMWRESFQDGGPIATTTIFNCARGENLPTREMLLLYHSMCKELYITYSDGQPEQNIEEKGLKEALQEDGIQVLDEYTEKEGIIVSRWRTAEEGWKVRCYGEARRVDDGYLSNYHLQIG